ncbi:hypothetical protein DID88_008747 [Monilinia fructigena]|uniref:Uncharacterized protein n=1 Tax=Monilinia fructigena TaxID=38457 RepID=A0A395J7C6_9HELO|nr:hypothetical protein DID88_008747 [Monilinia fructigena]
MPMKGSSNLSTKTPNGDNFIPRKHQSQGNTPTPYGPKDFQGYTNLSHLFMFILLDVSTIFLDTTAFVTPESTITCVWRIPLDSYWMLSCFIIFFFCLFCACSCLKRGQYSGLSWNGKSEGLQYSPRGSTSQGSNGFSDSLYIPVAQMPSQRWSTDLASGLESVEMTRFPSQESSRTIQSTSTSECALPMGYFPNASQAPYQISSARSDISGRSASPANSVLYTPTVQFDLPSAFDTFQYQGDESAGNDYQIPATRGFQQPPTLSLTTGGFDMFPSAHGLPTSMTAASSAISSYIHSAQDSVLFDSSIMGSPEMWDAALLESSKPHTPITEEWTLSPPMMSSTNSPLDYSPTEGRSPRIIRKPMGPKSFQSC